MKNQVEANKNLSTRKYSIISGITLIIMMFLAFFAIGYVQGTLYIEGNVDETLMNINSNQSLFQGGLVALSLIVIADVVVSYAFYGYLKSGNVKVAITSGLLRLSYSLILAIAVYILSTKDYEGFINIWFFGLIVFGFHLLVTAYGGTFIEEVPKVINILLVIAGLSYTIVNILYVFFPQVDSLTAILEMMLMLPMTLGEIGFGLWLLMKGGKKLPLNQRL